MTSPGREPALHAAVHTETPSPQPPAPGLQETDRPGALAERQEETDRLGALAERQGARRQEMPESSKDTEVTGPWNHGSLVSSLSTLLPDCGNQQGGTSDWLSGWVAGARARSRVPLVGAVLGKASWGSAGAPTGSAEAEMTFQAGRMCGCGRDAQAPLAPAGPRWRRWLSTV